MPDEVDMLPLVVDSVDPGDPVDSVDPVEEPFSVAFVV